MLALVDNQPELLTLKKALEVYYKHQLSVLLNRTKFDLEKSKARKHILGGDFTEWRDTMLPKVTRRL